ncbi:GNAT family N-acetyltransferase [Clostridium sp. LBM24168]
MRHKLTDELLKRGGHIGYGVRYSKWNKGYGTELLRQALLKSKSMNLHDVLITCNDDNIGSSKIIEKNGGLLENKLENKVNGKQILTRRYWIHIFNY